MSKNVKTFVIHLARSKQRREQVNHLLEATPFPAEVLNAVDGAQVPDKEIAALYSETAIYQPAYPFRLLPGEIGCFMSHQKAWQRIVDEELDGALILEDDVEIDPASFDRAVTLAAENLDRYGYIQFQVRKLKTPTQVAAEHDLSRLEKPQVVPLRTSGQMVSFAAAKAFLAASQKIDRPVDVYVQMPWVTGVDVVCAEPSGVSDRTAETGGSTIQYSKAIRGKLTRELKRFLYRFKISRLSKRHTGF